MISWRTSWRRLFAAAAPALTGWALVVFPAAGTPAPAKVALQKPADVQVKVRVIHARRTGKFIDKRVRSIEEKLRKGPFNFKSYRLVKEKLLTLQHGVKTRMRMPFKPVALRLTHLGFQDNKVRLRIRIGRKQAVTVLVEPGRTVLQGITLKNGQNFILAFTVQPR